MNEVLQHVVDLLPTLYEIVQENSYLTVLDADGIIVGYKIPEGEAPVYPIGQRFEDSSGAFNEVIRTGKKKYNHLPKEVMGMEVEGVLVPVKDGHTVVGCITYTFSVEEKGEVISMIHDFKSSIVDIHGSVGEIVSGIRDISVKLDEMSDKVSAVETNVGEATDIVKKIGKNAAKSNILGLNASIEAARSGEAGRGFTVVAAEMGKLANDSGSSAKEIDKKLEEITEHLNGMVESNHMANGVAKGHLEGIEQVEEKLNKILELADKTLKIMDTLNL